MKRLRVTGVLSVYMYIYICGLFRAFISVRVCVVLLYAYINKGMFNVYGWGPWAIQKQRNKIHPDLCEYMCLCQTIYGCLSRLRAAFDRLSVRRTLMTRRKYQDSVYLYIQLSVFSATQAIERTLFYFIFIILVFSVFHTNRTKPNQNSKMKQTKN